MPIGGLNGIMTGAAGQTERSEGEEPASEC